MFIFSGGVVDPEHHQLLVNTSNFMGFPFSGTALTGDMPTALPGVSTVSATVVIGDDSEVEIFSGGSALATTVSSGGRVLVSAGGSTLAPTRPSGC